MEPHRKGQQRSSIRIGLIVDIIRKEDQRNNKRTRGIVEEILTSSISHPHGIKEIIRFDDPGDTGKLAR
jgi:uncharacterized repeat protein (TIGR03833 family)